MPIVSLPSVITNAPLSGAWKARATRYIRKCMRISEWSFHSNRFHFVVLRNLVDHVQSLGDLSENGVDSVKVRLGGMTNEELAAAGVLPEVGHGAGHFISEQLHVDRTLRGLENGLFVRHHDSKERLSSTCATVFMPTITTDTASLSSTKRRASCAGVTPAWPARSFTRSATARSCAT